MDTSENKSSVNEHLKWFCTDTTAYEKIVQKFWGKLPKKT